MEKTITVDKLIEGYSSLTSDKVKEEYLNRNIKTVNHLDIAVLDVIATSIINASSFDENGLININSFKRYILEVFAYIDNCTSIEIDSTDWSNQYDRLKVSGLLDEIIKRIPENVVSDIQTVVQMKYDDLLTNYQMKRYDKISYIPESLILGISKALENITETISNNNIDWDSFINKQKK